MLRNPELLPGFGKAIQHHILSATLSVLAPAEKLGLACRMAAGAVPNGPQRTS
jgi:hypothetical protein